MVVIIVMMMIKDREAPEGTGSWASSDKKR